jgi:uncharacterized protein YidB (DUF937 family)
MFSLYIGKNMSILDNLMNKAHDLTGTKEKTDITDALTEMLVNTKGGLNGLIDKFTQNGLGNTISSWIGTGENKTITAEQIRQVFGNDKIKELADKTGLSVDDTSIKVSEMLPGMLDKLTPEGKVPEGNLFSKGLGYIRSILH